jgi:hypothetical protein
MTELVLVLATFYHGKSGGSFLTKMCWASFWASFSQTYLVTLGLTVKLKKGTSLIISSANKNISLQADRNRRVVAPTTFHRQFS